jgi:hypothetical protein
MKTRKRKTNLASAVTAKWLFERSHRSPQPGGRRQTSVVEYGGKMGNKSYPHLEKT